ncbi:uncharacterized protein LOC123507782 isoform X2 [Portunus trituberculatus]|uniref:uncharacterized protein LOC123507782 isoform X2 n=1 Tax=Portunus trituberculatus TaxID=210409 RepID=UPI001E1CDC5E|nr:uncharacterized protein LOC123507782 isoform X2 [Portunus trituberculatus]
MSESATSGELKTRRPWRTVCRTTVLPVLVTVMVAGLGLEVCIVVEHLLTEEHESIFTVTSPEAVDSLGQMRTVGPGIRWPLLLLLTSVLTLSVLPRRVTPCGPLRPQILRSPVKSPVNASAALLSPFSRTRLLSTATPVHPNIVRVKEQREEGVFRMSV